MSEATWAALAATLTLLAGLWTVHAFRRRGVASGLRGAGITLLPAAAYLTGTLEMFTEIGRSVADWATHLVFSPIVWVGVVLAGLAVVLLVVSGMLRDRGLGGPRQPGAASARDPRKAPKPALGEPARPTGAPAVGDDDMADIEAILRKRGIS